MRGGMKGNDPYKASGGFIEKQGTRGDMAVKVRPDEMSAPQTDLTTHPRPWTKLPRNKRTKLSTMGLGKEYLEKGDPRYKRAMELANKYRKARMRELAAIHGFVSSGTSALLATASLALAASRFLYELFAANGSESDIDILRKAASMADSARQSELAAWELAAREALIKRKMDMNAQVAPWMLPQGGQKPGTAKIGRPRKSDVAEMAQVPPPPVQREMTIDAVIAEVAKESKETSCTSTCKPDIVA